MRGSIFHFYVWYWAAPCAPPKEVSRLMSKATRLPFLASICASILAASCGISIAQLIPKKIFAVGNGDGYVRIMERDVSWIDVSPGNWVDVTPAGEKGYLRAIDIVSSSIAHAVGGRTIQGKAFTKCMMRKGGGWYDVSPGIEGELTCVDMLSETKGFAAGWYHDQQLQKEFMRVLRWNGVTWFDVSPSPAVEGEPCGITMFSSTDGYITGTYYDPQLQKHFIRMLRWDGNVWSDVSPSTMFDGGIRGVFMLSSTDGYAAGGYYDQQLQKDFMRVLRWDGSTWSDVSPSPAVEGRFNGVFMLSSTEGYAVGSWYDQGAQETYMKVMSWDGNAWTDVSPSPAVSGDLRNVYMASAAEGIAVGSWSDNNTNELYAKTLTWDGSSWTAATIPNAESLEDVAIGPPSMTLWINFQKLTSVIPAGYTADTGGPYDPSTGYGW